ncbi:PAS domain-containing hybrid sensor histidine kinase/response regulator [Methylobacter marinus]|uniref:PAS domain-containing hybrid sensor histidine kinase/response regulator n=1 Tax=Methylobacter marinus TaxID=34058 RepID=UPI00037D3477|nr:PAS domain S-box protein [Methylobacter marinus]
MISKPDKFYALRKRAEELLVAPHSSSASYSLAEFRDLLHELDMHRIELELQNDELLKAQRQLQDTNQEYLDFYNFSPVGYLTLDSNGIILKASMTAAGMFGSDKQAIITKPFSDFVLDADQDVLYFYRQALLNHKRAQSCELRLCRSNGQYLWVKLDGLFQTAPEGHDFRLALTDINHLKETEALLSKSEANLRAIFDNVLDGIIKIDEQGLIESTNTAIEHIFGFSTEELSGTVISKLIPKLDWRAYKSRLSHCQDGGKSRFSGLRCELEGLKKDGAWFPVDLGISEISNDQPSCFIITVHDITERKQTEIALQQADCRKNEFLAMLGHELRNPLAPIRNAVQVLKTQSSTSPTLDWCLKVIDRQVGHMALLLDDLLDVARIMQDKITLKIDHVDFNEIIDSAIETSYPMIQLRQQELLTSRPDTPMWVEGDRVRLTQALSNLLNNAAKYTDIGGKIMLTVTQEAEDLVIQVQDNGAGIAPEILPHIFDLFTQADSSLARSQGGLGIGLTLTRRLVEMHGGTISASSAGNQQGSEFTLRLPLFNAPSIPQPEPSEPVPAAAKLRILLVDDNADVAESLALLLEIQGHELDTADCGLKAIEMAQTFRPQVVLLDIGLPDINGYEVAKRLRKLPETRRAFLIAISGYGQPEDLEQSKSAGFDHHLLKPVHPLKLSSLLTSVEAEMDAVVR